MRRRALLASTALAATAGCLGDARAVVSGSIRHDHSRGRIAPAGEAFVRGGLTAASGDAAAAWFFPAAPPDDETVFSDVFGAEPQREWDNEVHNENYETGFVLLAQFRSPRSAPRGLRPPLSPDPAWTGWSGATLPLAVEPASLDAEDFPEARTVTYTLLAYYATDGAPDSATVELLSNPDGEANPGGRLRTVEAERWSSR